MKNIRVERSYGHLLLRSDNRKYKLIDDTDKECVVIAVPDSEAAQHIRVGGVYKEVKPVKKEEVKEPEQEVKK